MRKYASTVVLVLLAITSVLPSAWAQSRGKGNEGNPAVLNELDEVQRRLDQIEAQMQANQTALLDRMDAIVTLMGQSNDGLLARFDTVDVNALEYFDDVAPCTIDRIREGKCHPLDFETTICFDLSIDAAGALQWEIAPGIGLSGGAGWPNVLVLEGVVQLELPLPVTVPPLLPIILPDVAIGAQVGAGGRIQICFAGVSVGFSDIFGPGSERVAGDDFAQKWVDAIEETGGEIVGAMRSLADAKNLTPDKLVAPLNLLQSFEATVSGCDDPLEILQTGQLRDFLESLPTINGMADLCDDPSMLLPKIDPANPFAGFCAQAENMSIIGELVGPMCDSLDAFPVLKEVEFALDAIEATINVIETVVSFIADVVCELDFLDVIC